MERIVRRLNTSTQPWAYLGTPEPEVFEQLAQEFRGTRTIYLLDNTVEPYGPQLLKQAAYLLKLGIGQQHILGYTSDARALVSDAPIQFLPKDADINQIMGRLLAIAQSH
jgi:hypothetical protein